MEEKIHDSHARADSGTEKKGKKAAADYVYQVATLVAVLLLLLTATV